MPRPHSLQQGKSSSTGNLLDKEDLALPPPDYGTSSRAFPAQTAGPFKQRPYSVAMPAFSQVSWGPWQGPLMGGLGCSPVLAPPLEGCGLGGLGLASAPLLWPPQGAQPDVLYSLRALEKARRPLCLPFPRARVLPALRLHWTLPLGRSPFPESRGAPAIMGPSADECLPLRA